MLPAAPPRGRALRRRRARLGAGVAYPRHLERAYAGRLLRRMRAAHHAAMERLGPALDGARARHDEAGDPVPPPPLPSADELVGLVAAARAAWERMFAPDASGLLGVAAQVNAYTARRVAASLGLATVDVTRGPNDKAIQTAWARANVDLITSLDARYFDDIARVVREGLAAGRTGPDIAADLRGRLGVSESRARLIARDQVAKLNTDITRDRHEDAGVTHYEWSTSGDERVRPAHRALDGKVFAWDDPPSEGHPGQAVQCRCVALPILGDEGDD